MRLVPCPDCRRHADALGGACPFCGARLALTEARARPRVATLTRAAIFYLGASVASVGCGVPDDEPVVQPYGAPPDPPPEDRIAQPYGAPPDPDESPQPQDPSADDDETPQTAVDGADAPPPPEPSEPPDRAIAPPYGVPPRPDDEPQRGEETEPLPPEPLAPAYGGPPPRLE